MSKRKQSNIEKTLDVVVEKQRKVFMRLQALRQSHNDEFDVGMSIASVVQAMVKNSSPWHRCAMEDGIRLALTQLVIEDIEADMSCVGGNETKGKK